MIKKLLDLAKENNIKLEVAISKSVDTNIETLNDRVEKFEEAVVTTYKIKSLINNKIVNITTEDISDPDKIIEDIVSNASILDNNYEVSFAKEIDIQNNDIDFVEQDYEKVKQDLIKLNKYKDKYPNLKSINMYYTNNYNKINIINDEVNLIDTNNLIYVYAELIWNENGINQTGFFDIVLKEYNYEKIKNKFKETIRDMAKKIDANSCKSGRYSIILKNNQVFKLLKTYSSMFNAENINKKLSLLSDDYNKQVFSKEITIVEDPLNKDLLGTRLFDIEGNKTYYKEIIKNGKFITKLYDNKTSLKENTNPTGTSDGVRNMYILPGKYSYEELIRDMKDGIIIDSIEGLHAGANVLTGELSLQATGYVVENGIIGNALKLIIFQTSIKELFNKVRKIGNDLEFTSVIGGSPSILFDNIMIVGKE